MNPPLAFRWDGEAMRPLRPRAADRVYVIGAVYFLEEAPERRSIAAHRHYFATLKEAWTQLPEAVADLYPSPEHLRKRALIDAGWYDETIVEAGSKAAALRVAAYARGADDFAMVVTRGPLVIVRKAKSQALRAMGKAEFQASSAAVIGRIADLIGVKADELGRNAA